MSDLEEMAPHALALAGIPFSDSDLEVLRVVALAFEPAMSALDGVELAQLPLEPDLDPGRPPRATPGR